MNAYAMQQQYSQNHIETASAEQIMILLYEGAIRFIRQAKIASKENNTTWKVSRINKAFAIIIEFSNTLNHDIGGEIAEDLDGLYQFMLRELNKARTETEDTCLEVVETLLVDLLETWNEAIIINKKDIYQNQSNSSVAISG